MFAIVGFAAEYNLWRPRADGGWRQFATGAFDEGLDGRIDLLVNHGLTRVWGRRGPLATTANGSLSVFVNAAGLCFRARCSDRTLSARLDAGPLRVSVGAQSDVVERGRTQTSVRSVVTEISLLVGMAAGNPRTWCRHASRAAERELVRLDLDARARAIEALRAAG
jgi:hypothetical protein